MTILKKNQSRLRAFTLIELLVVISIIGVLAGMLIPAGVHLKNKASVKQAQTQMEQISTWIESYKAKLGQYPPGKTNNLNPNWKDSEDNPARPARPPLFYELTGAELTPAGYRTERGIVLAPAQLPAAFGNGYTLIANSSRATQPGDNPDESQKKQNFAKNIAANSIAAVPVNPSLTIEVLASKIRGPMGLTNVWHYTVDQGSRNQNSYDLWLDVVLGGKTYRICNWSSKPIKL